MSKHPDLQHRRLVFLDCETTGLDPQVHEMIEVAAVVAHPNKNGVPPTMFEAKIKPEHIERAHPKALEVNGYNEQEWENARPLQEVLPEFLSFLEGAVIGGQNTRFDVGFINAAIDRLGLAVRVDYHVLDVSTLAYEHLVPLGLKSLSLRKICDFLGIQPEPGIHRALNGAKRALDVYYALCRASWMDRLRWKLANRD